MWPHGAFDELAGRTQAGGTRDDVIRGLAGIVSHCVACHVLDRLDEGR